MIAAVVGRLRATVDNRTFRFQNTRRADADAYLAQLTTFEGCTDAEIAAREEQLGGTFPLVYRSFLRRCGRKSGELFVGSDIGFDRHEEMGRGAEWLMAEWGLDGGLPAKADVFLTHQGYSFLFVRAEGGYDAPAYSYVEGEPGIERAYETFADLLDSHVALIEENHAAARSHGGTWLTIRPDGGTSETYYPAYVTGERPIELGDRFLD